MFQSSTTFKYLNFKAKYNRNLNPSYKMNKYQIFNHLQYSWTIKIQTYDIFKATAQKLTFIKPENKTKMRIKENKKFFAFKK